MGSGARGIKMLGSTDASLFGLGAQMLSEVAAGVLIGLAADYLLGTHNRWIVVGSIAGVAVAMWTVIRTTIRLGKRDSAERARRSAAGGRRSEGDQGGGPA
jgi:F0F1-type ATP synthase assembly protein I